MMDQIGRNDDFLKKTFDADARPYLRPPYGAHNATVDAVAAGLGYTVMTLWSGDLGDSNLVSEQSIVRAADKFFTPQTVVIGQLNTVRGTGPRIDVAARMPGTRPGMRPS